MSMTGYTKLFASIVTSTVWREPDHVRLVWVTMLALSDRHGVVEASVPGLADMARVSVEQCRDALKRLLEPDEDSRTQEHKGRRIQPVDGGWQLLNHAKYRHKLSADERREYDRIRKAEYRKSAKSQNVPDMSAVSTQAEAEAEADTEATPKAQTPKVKSVRRASRSAPETEPTDFLTFWSLYPNRKGKQAALKAWRKLNPDANLIGVMASALVWQKGQPQWTKDGGQFVPMLSTWLNGRRWEDEVDTRPQVSDHEFFRIHGYRRES